MSPNDKNSNPVKRRLRQVRRAWRAFSWQVVRHPDTQLSRWTWFKIALGYVRCGVVTGGNHWWGPLRAEYEGQKRRKHKCRLCGAKMTPASEIAADPLTDEAEARFDGMVGKPSQEDVERAVQALSDQGLIKGGKTIWD